MVDKKKRSRIMSSRTIKQLREQEKANHIAILKQGWLTKKGALMGAPRFVVAHAAAGAKVKNWKRRWCVLVDGQGSDSAAELLYCKTRKNFFFFRFDRVVVRRCVAGRDQGAGGCI